ncbi:unnamed protein product [Polarella glacialis]|uniref:SSD domain-containing protein n=1 Tax=Polarella glacialis TaxID=89957 RepID=A0A813FTY4_POLGL|nr:unnamed protein product [Polarella glacialis]
MFVVVGFVVVCCSFVPLYVYFLHPKRLQGFPGFRDDDHRQRAKFHNFVGQELYPLVSSASTEDIRIFYYGDELTAYEVQISVFHDAGYAIGSLLFILCYLIWYMRSFWLAITALACIAVSFPLSYACYCLVYGHGKMIAINFLSLFVVLGVGADDVFVLHDVWKHSRAAGTGEMALARRLWSLYCKAGSAIFATSATTAASFFANLASSIGPLRQFGFFMGTCIAVNYIVVASLYPFILVNHERSRCKGGRMLQAEDGAIEMEEQLVSNFGQQTDEEADAGAGRGVRSAQRPPSSEQRLSTPWRLLACGISLSGLVLTGGALSMAVRDLKPANGVPQFFPKESNLGALQDLQKRFGNESSVAGEDLKYCNGIYIPSAGQCTSRATDGQPPAASPPPFVIPKHLPQPKPLPKPLPNNNDNKKPQPQQPQPGQPETTRSGGSAHSQLPASTSQTPRSPGTPPSSDHEEAVPESTAPPLPSTTPPRRPSEAPTAPSPVVPKPLPTSPPPPPHPLPPSAPPPQSPPSASAAASAHTVEDFDVRLKVEATSEEEVRTPALALKAQILEELGLQPEDLDIDVQPRSEKQKVLGLGSWQRGELVPTVPPDKLRYHHPCQKRSATATPPATANDATATDAAVATTEMAFACDMNVTGALFGALFTAHTFPYRAVLAREGLKAFVLSFSGLDRLPLRGDTGQAWRAALRMKTVAFTGVWSIFVCTCCLIFLSFYPISAAENGQVTDGGHILRYHMCVYALCVASQATMRVWPESASRVIDVLFELLHLAMLIRQITTPSHMALIFSSCSKLVRCWLCVNMADRRRIVVWNVLIGIAGIWRNTSVLEDSIHCRHPYLSDNHTRAAQVAAVATEFLCCIICFLISSGIEDVFSGYESAITAELATNDRLSAVRRMLTVFCDAQVLIVHSLHISGPQEMFANFLKMGSATSSASLEGVAFTSFLVPGDRSRFEEFVASGLCTSSGIFPTALPCGSLHVQMLDATGSLLHVELFHVCIPEAKGLASHLIGIREQSEESAGVAVNDTSVVEHGHGSAPESSPDREESGLQQSTPTPAALAAEQLHPRSTSESGLPRDPVFGTLASAPLPRSTFIFGPAAMGDTGHDAFSEASSGFASHGSMHALPFIQNIDICFDAFAEGLPLKSVQIRFVEPTAHLLDAAPPRMQDFLSESDFAALRDWVQDAINANSHDDTNPKRRSTMELNFGETSVASEEQELFIVGLGWAEEDGKESEDGEIQERSGKEQAGLERHHQEDMEPDMHGGGDDSGMEADKSEDSYREEGGPLDELKVVLRLASLSAAQIRGWESQRRRKVRRCRSRTDHPVRSAAMLPSVQEADSLPRAGIRRSGLQDVDG